MWGDIALLKLSHNEEHFLRRWVYDEVHYEQGPGPAKRLQLEHRVTPADLAIVVAAAIPDASDQAALGSGPPPAERPAWPWSDESLRARLAEARSLLSAR